MTVDCHRARGRGTRCINHESDHAFVRCRGCDDCEKQPLHSDRRDPKLSTATKLFSSGGRSAVTRRSATKQAKRSSRCRGAFCTRRAHRLTTPRRLRSESPGPGSTVHPPRRWWRTPSLPPPPRRSAGCRRWDRELGSTLPPALCRSRPWRLRRFFFIPSRQLSQLSCGRV